MSLVSLWDHFNSSITFRIRYVNLVIFWPNFSKNIVKTRIKISKFMKPLLRSRYVCLKVCLYAFYRHLYVMNLGLKTLQLGSNRSTGIRISKYSTTDPRKQLFSLNIIWLSSLIFLSLLVQNVKIQVLFDPILR